MIDIAREQLIPISDVPRRLPLRPNGRRVHISAVYRWITRGVRGVRLESIRIGGSRYTSVEALQAFGQHLSNAEQPPAPSVVRRRQIDRAKREAEAILRADRRENHQRYREDDD